MDLLEVQLSELLMKLNLKTKEYQVLCYEFEKLQDKDIQDNDSKYAKLKSKFENNQKEIEEIKRKIEELIRK